MVAVYYTMCPHANLYVLYCLHTSCLVYVSCVPSHLPLNLNPITPASFPPPSPGSICDPYFTKSLNPPLC